MRIASQGHLRRFATTLGMSAPGGTADVNRQIADINGLELIVHVGCRIAASASSRCLSRYSLTSTGSNYQVKPWPPSCTIGNPGMRDHLRMLGAETSSISAISSRVTSSRPASIVSIVSYLEPRRRRLGARRARISHRIATETATKKARENPDHAHQLRVMIAYRRRSLEGPAVDRGLQESMPNVVGSRFMLAT